MKWRRNNPWRWCQVIQASGSGSMTCQTVGMRHSIPGRGRLKWQDLCASLLPLPWLSLPPLPVPRFIEDPHSEVTKVGKILWGPKLRNVVFHGARQVLSPWNTEPACSTQLNLALFAHKGSRNWFPTNWRFQTTLQCCGLSPVLEGTGNDLKFGRHVLKLFPAPFKNKSVHLFQSLL